MDARAPLTEPDPAAAATPGTVPALFFRRVAELGDQTALRQKVLGLWRDISWTDYGENVRAAACGLIALGVAPGDCVAIIGENIPDSEFEIRTEGREISRTLDEPAVTASVVQRMDGWQLGWRPEGFVPAAAPRSGKGQAVAFSDGLAAFSVFVEPAGPVSMPTGASLIGATTVYMHQVTEGDSAFLVTVVGELPPQTARQVAESVRIEDSVALGAGEP